MVLGSEVADETLLTLRRGSGLIGFVSHVYMWNVTLAAGSEITTMADSRNNLVRFKLTITLLFTKLIVYTKSIDVISSLNRCVEAVCLLIGRITSQWAEPAWSDRAQLAIESVRKASPVPSAPCGCQVS